MLSSPLRVAGTSRSSSSSGSPKARRTTARILYLLWTPVCWVLRIRRPVTITGRPGGDEEIAQLTESPVDIAAVREFLDREQIHTVECMFADTWGIPRGKRLSTRHFCSCARGDGFAIANVAFTWDMHGVIFPTRFVDDVAGYPDMHVVPD